MAHPSTRQLTLRFALLLTLSLLALGMVGNFDVASEYVMEAMEKEMRPARVMQVHRELDCDCTKLNAERKWLEYQIAQKPDKKSCHIFCQYGKPKLIAESL